MNPPVAVAMHEIVIDDSLQPRCDGLSEDHVQALQETPESWPPVVLARVNGSLFLIDGFHRHEAARSSGASSLMATIFDPAEGADLFDIAFQLNVKHGRPLTLCDRKAYAVALLRDHPERSDRELGRRSGLNHETIGALRAAELASARPPERKPGALPDDVSLFDPIRRAKATREQKAIAGYVQRVAIALADPYSDASTLDSWPDDPAAITGACYATMGEQRATQVLVQIEEDTRFLLSVARARKHITSTAKEKIS